MWHLLQLLASQGTRTRYSYAMSNVLPLKAPIRAIVSRFSYDFSKQAMENALARVPFQFCGIISVGRDPDFFSVIPPESQQWFCSSDIRSGIYDNTDWSSLLPLDQEILGAMRGCEAVFMDMVGRLEWKRRISFQQRHDWYHRHLRFWNDYLTKQNINLFISAWLPHEIPDIVIYHLCKIRNIPVLYFHTSSVRDISFAEHDIRDSAAQIGKRYEALLQEYSHIQDPSQIPLRPLFDQRFAALIRKAGEKPPVESVKRKGYWGNTRQLFLDKPLEFLKAGFGYLTPEGMVRAAGALHRGRLIKERNRFYDAHAVHPDFDVPFVYLPLHFQPEASTVPMGGAYADQILLTELLSAHLPKDVLIYIKEHPRQSSWLDRTTEDYQRLIALPNVLLIARDVDTFQLREQCRAVATVTGSAGFEALFRGKPVLLFGYRFYQYARGVFRIYSTEDLKQAVRQIFDEGAAPTLVEARVYLRAMEETGIRGVLNPWHMKVTGMTEEEHVKNNTEAILGELQTIFL